MKKCTILLLGVGMLLGMGCSKDAENDLNNKSLSSAEVKAQIHLNSTTEGLDELLAGIWLNYTSDNTTAKTGSDCATLSYTEKNITVTYDQCTINGHILNGSLTLTGDNANVANRSGGFIIGFDNFSFNDYHLEGTKSFTFDYSVASRLVLTIVTDVTLKNEQGETIDHEGNKELTLHFDQTEKEGVDFSCIGKWNLVHNGTTYGFKIIKPLSGTFGCASITSGILTLEMDNLTASLDFGQGACDQKGTVTYPNGKSEEISW